MSSLGVGVACITSVGPRFSLASEKQCLGQALARRLITPRGSMPWAPNDGTDIRDLMNSTSSGRKPSQLAQAVKDECEKDDRVDSASVDVQMTADTATVTATITTADGPFDLVLSVDSLTVDILAVT